MAKVDGAISSLIQGVSQQPARERLPGQGESQENFTSDPVNGLVRRGPTEYVDELINSASTYTFSDYDAGSIGHFVMAHKAGELKVFDLDGTENTVTIVSGGSYIPSTELQFVAVDDDIYVVDPAKTTAMLSGSQTYVDNAALVFLLGGQFGRTYEITVTWGATTITANMVTANGGTSSDINQITTDNIMLELFDGTGLSASATPLSTLGTFTSAFDYFLESDVMYIIPKTGSGITSFEVKVQDGDGGSNMFAVNNSTADVGRIPRFAPHGYIVQVSESGSTTTDDWYLQFQSTIEVDSGSPTVGDGFGDVGKWVETVAPDLDYQLDPATMPHVLESTGTNTFDFREAVWEDRAVGDDDTNPEPSFIGNTISDIGAFQGRLTLLSDVNIIMSRTGKYTNFFSQSATTLADDDPIDVSSSLGIFILHKMVPHNRDLVLFSDRAQFIIFGRNSLTPANTSMVLTSEFDADLSTAPVAAGRNIFFPFHYGNYTGIHEFFTDGSEDVNDARAITTHVLQYIEGTPTQLVSTTNFDKLIVRTDNDAKTVYVYEYVWQDRQKLQSSWSKWSIDRDIKRMFFVDNLLYIVTQASTAYELWTIDLDDTAHDTATGYRVMLDEHIDRAVANTTFSVPYSIDDIANYICVQGLGCPTPGMRVLISELNGSTVTVDTDMSGGTVHFGKKFTSTYVPTAPFVRDRDGVKVGSGKLTIRQYVVHFDDTGYLKANITDDFGYAAEVVYNGRVLGNPNNIVGEPAVSTGSFRVPFKKNADTSQLQLSSDSHLPLSLLELEWTGQWKKKGKRITGG